MQRIPILQMGKCLLVTIQVDLQDQTALALQDDLSAKIEATGAHGVLIDISALEIVDSFIGRMLAGISGIARVLDATTVVVGMQPAVAITLVELGLSLEGVRTALNVERGMQMLRDAAEEDGLDAADLRARWSCATEQDIVMSRQTVRKLTQELSFSLVDQTKMITAASELSRNTVVYGGGGEMRWQIVTQGLEDRPAPRVRGQGARASPTSTLALTDGWTSGKGLGVGLSGSKRLVNEFDIRTAVGEGTCVTITRWK